MTIKYLVTGRAGMSNWEYTGSYAVKKTYGFKKIEDMSFLAVQAAYTMCTRATRGSRAVV